jgi:hypothetical protein
MHYASMAYLLPHHLHRVVQTPVDVLLTALKLCEALLLLELRQCTELLGDINNVCL